MPILSSRPAVQTLTDDEVRILATPSVNLVVWLSSVMRLPDVSLSSTLWIQAMISDALDCMELHDFVVSPMPSSLLQLNNTVFEIAVKPVEDAPFVIFNATFRT